MQPSKTLILATRRVSYRRTYLDGRRNLVDVELGDDSLLAATVVACDVERHGCVVNAIEGDRASRWRVEESGYFCVGYILKIVGGDRMGGDEV